jgi:DNA-binding response OmpR family regulator
MERKQKILAVSSDREFVKATDKALKPSYELDAAYTREEAQAKAVKSPDLIILGYLQPRGTSFELHRQLRREPVTKDIPLLIVDVRPEEHLQKGWRRNEGMQMDADDYVSQPIAPAELRKTIGKILQRVSQEPMEMSEVLAQMEDALNRIDRIEAGLGVAK